jgi:hypothetical protein
LVGFPGTPENGSRPNAVVARASTLVGVVDRESTLGLREGLTV